MRPCPERSRRPLSMRRPAPIAWCIAMLLALPPHAARAQQFDYNSDGNNWQMPQPPATKGEFKGDDPIGLASRQHIPTDCSINWQDEGGRMYCFASNMSSQIFQEERASILPKAAAFWAEEHGGKPGAKK